MVYFIRKTYQTAIYERCQSIFLSEWHLKSYKALFKRTLDYISNTLLLGEGNILLNKNTQDLMSSEHEFLNNFLYLTEYIISCNFDDTTRAFFSRALPILIHHGELNPFQLMKVKYRLYI